jgi:hypothetical protein
VFSRGGKYGPAGRAHGQQDWARPFLMAALAQSHTCVSNLHVISQKRLYGMANKTSLPLPSGSIGLRSLRRGGHERLVFLDNIRNREP